MIYMIMQSSFRPCTILYYTKRLLQMLRLFKPSLMCFVFSIEKLLIIFSRFNNLLIQHSLSTCSSYQVMILHVHTYVYVPPLQYAPLPPPFLTPYKSSQVVINFNLAIGDCEAKISLCIAVQSIESYLVYVDSCHGWKDCSGGQRVVTSRIPTHGGCVNYVQIQGHQLRLVCYSSKHCFQSYSQGFSEDLPQRGLECLSRKIPEQQ